METAVKPKMRVVDMVYIAMFAVVMAVCAWISIPGAVPFTLQTMGVFLAVALLGGKRGTLAVLVYLLLGAVGMPVFAGFHGGLGYMLGATGGYIVGFLLSALVMWGIEALLGKNIWVLAISMVLGLGVCYAFGTAWFMVVYAQKTGPIGLGAALGLCVIPYIVPDLVKLALALLLQKLLSPVLRLR